MEKAVSAKLSVIIPCYNAEEFLPRAFDCLDSQSYENLQIIFIDDGSKDGTLNLIKDYCAKNSRAEFITGENQGVGASRNKGLDLIKGEYFTFYDADDIIYSNHFENLLDIMVKNSADLSACGIKRLKESRLKEKYSTAKTTAKLETFYDKDAFCQYLSQEKFDFVLWNKVFSTKTLKESGARFLDTRYGEEAFFLYTYFKRVNKVVFSADKTYIYIQHKKSLMHLGFNESRLDILTNLNKVKLDAEDYSKEISNYVSSMRAGYLVGLLYFIKKSKFNDGKIIGEIISMLSQDVKLLKYCKKTAGYKRAFIPLVAKISKLAFRKALKKA